MGLYSQNYFWRHLTLVILVGCLISIVEVSLLELRLPCFKNNSEIVTSFVIPPPPPTHPPLLPQLVRGLDYYSVNIWWHWEPAYFIDEMDGLLKLPIFGAGWD